MSEVDRLSNSGLYPALPVSDRRGSNHPNPQTRDENPAKPETEKPADPAATGRHPRPPKSIIDEYA